MHTCRSIENGRHSWKVVFERKSLKNCGQDCSVKLLPILVSNGRGSEVDTGVAVCINSETEDVEDEAGIPEEPAVVAVDELLESSCLA